MIGNCPGVDAVARALMVAKVWNSDETRSADLAFEIRGFCSAPCRIGSTSPSGDASPHRAGNQHSHYVKESDSFVAHALSVPRRDSSRRLEAVQPKTTKQTQSRRTPMTSTPSKDEPRSADLAVEIRGFCSAPSPTDSTGPLLAPIGCRIGLGNRHSRHARRLGQHSRPAAQFKVRLKASDSLVRSGHILNGIVQVHPEHFLRQKTFSIENVL